MGVVWGLEKLQYYLLGSKIDLITDHKALEEILNKRVFGNSRINRWMDRLSVFNFNMIYRKGMYNISADALSRNPDQTENLDSKNIKDDEQILNTVCCKLIR